MSQVKAYSWKEIIRRVLNPTNTYYAEAMDYYHNFYVSDENTDRLIFTELDVTNIIREIQSYMNYKQILEEQDAQEKQLRKDFPNLDAYIESLSNRVPRK